jgi:hypothetical protein
VAELDYAFLAEFAQITDGKLTAVNASFVDVKTPLPAMFQFAVAGRVRAPADVQSAELVITLINPDDSNTFALNAELFTAGHTVYAGRVGMLFALRMAIPISMHGLYRVRIDLDGEEARRLAFEAAAP